MMEFLCRVRVTGADYPRRDGRGAQARGEGNAPNWFPRARMAWSADRGRVSAARVAAMRALARESIELGPGVIDRATGRTNLRTVRAITCYLSAGGGGGRGGEIPFVIQDYPLNFPRRS